MPRRPPKHISSKYFDTENSEEMTYARICPLCQKKTETIFNDACYYCWYKSVTYTPYGEPKDLDKMEIRLVIRDVLWEGTIVIDYKDLNGCILIRDEEEDDDGLSTEERKAMLHLNEAWNHFVKLPIQHNDDISEFRHAIHRLQHLIMIRPMRRNCKAYTNEQRDKKGK